MCKNMKANKETHYLFVKGKEVPVTKEVYKAYVSASGKFGYEYKKAKRYGVTVVSLHNLLEKNMEFSDATVSDEETIIENLDLQKAIKSLSEFEQQVVMMRYFQDIKLADISKQLNVPYTTVFDTIERLLVKIKTKMSQII